MNTETRALACLKQYWGHSGFREQQLEIIKHVLDGHDTVVLFPTGGGKSLCFQLPALLLDNLTVVITPLIALMQDQVAGLLKKGVPAVAIHSGISLRDAERHMDNCQWGGTKLLYISPERYCNEDFQYRLAQMAVSLVVVDEAHCISQWGHDFRPAYRQIGQMNANFPDSIRMAVTGTATTQVLADIETFAGLRKPKVFRKSFKRDNISLNVIYAEDKFGTLRKMAPNMLDKSAIIYVRSRKDTKHVADIMNDCGMRSANYHAGMEMSERQSVMNQFMNGNIEAVCATNAFGMGIDKSDVRKVIHLDVPPSLEEYVQEFGRAGRDGLPSSATMIIDESDLLFAEKKALEKFISIDLCRSIYGLLHKYFQIPTGSGEGSVGHLQIEVFAQYAGCQVKEVFYALNILEKNGYIEMFEQQVNLSKVKVLSSIEFIRQNELPKEESEMLINLVRLYEGILTESVNINTVALGQHSNQKPEAAASILATMHEKRLIYYERNQPGSKVKFLMDRLADGSFHINMKMQQNEIKAATDKISAMIHYIRSEKCRWVNILTYFDEIKSKNCDHCDSCEKRLHGDLEYQKKRNKQRRLEEGME